MSVVSGNEVAGCCRSVVKVNPNGVDLAPMAVRVLPTDLTILLHGEQRGYIGQDGKVSSEKQAINPDADGFYNFEKGRLYELRFAEVSVPPTCTGLAFPRSSMNRLGIIKLESAVFDSGYRGEPTQVIFAPIPAKVHKNEALIQLVFLRNEKPAETLYSGFYQNEKG